jgi:large subunit ribosomal protein L19
MDILKKVNSNIANATLPDLRPGLTVKVHQKIKEGSKTRTQIFEGLVIAHKHGSGPNATITVRKISNGIGVERVFPLHMPTIEKFEVVKRAKVRRAKLYYLRNKTVRETRKKTKVLPLNAAPAAKQDEPQETAAE